VSCAWQPHRHSRGRGSSPLPGCDPDRRLSGRAICRAGVVVAVTDLADDQPITWRWSSQVSLGCPSVAPRAVHRLGPPRTRRALPAHPYLAAETARGLADAGVGVVGIDSMNPDSSVQGTTYVHETLLDAACCWSRI